MAEIAGVDPDCITAWSRRSTRLREWARNNLTVIDGAPTAAQLAAAQKATRPAKPESLAWPDLSRSGAPTRAVCAWTATHISRRAPNAAHRSAAHSMRRTSPTWQRTSTRPTFTRADMVELIGAQLPVDAPANHDELIEQIVDSVGMRISAPREAHHREGHERFTLEAILAEEATHSRDGRRDRQPRTPRPARRRRRRPIPGSAACDPPHRRITVAGAAACRHPPVRARPTRCGVARRRAPDAQRRPGARADREGRRRSLSDGAGDEGLTIAKALALIEDRRLTITRSTLVVVDEASMVGTPDLDKLLTCTTTGRAKTVLVGDAHQLSRR